MPRKTKKKAATKSAQPKPAKRKSAKSTGKNKILAIPKGFHTLAPYLAIAGCAEALAFYREAFGAKEVFRLADPAGRIGHAEMRIGDSILMMAEENPSFGTLGPRDGACPIRLYLAVKNVDSFVEKALAAGAKLVRPVQDQFYGERSGMISDPFGYSWLVATQIEKVSPKTMQKRWNEIMAKSASA